MIRFLVFSDIHVHNYPRFGGPTEDGLNIRAQTCLTAMGEVSQYAEKNEINTIVFAGDWFVPRTSIDFAVLNAVRSWVTAIKDSGIQFIMVPGNHDRHAGHTDGVYVLADLLQSDILDDVSYFNIPGSEDGENVIGVTVPFVSDENKLKEMMLKATIQSGDKILFAHTPVFHATSPTGYTFPFGLVLDGSVRNLYIGGFFGDNHRHQSLGHPFYSVGSLIQHDFGDVLDAGQRGFLDVTVEDHKISSVKLIKTDAPEFKLLRLHPDMQEIEVDKKNYYRVFSNKIVSKEGLEYLSKKISNYEIAYEIHDGNMEVETLSKELDKKSIFEEYLKQNTVNNKVMVNGISFDVDRLCQMGTEVF